MPPDSAWSHPFNKSEIKLSSAQIGWKNFMNECLMETKIFNCNENENEKCLRVDPNFVMDTRHRLVRQSVKNIPMPQILIHTEALKLLRIENHNRLLRQKEGKMVEKEIAKLKQMLENHRLFTKKRIIETTNKRSKSSSNMQAFSKHTRLWKRLEYCDGTYNVDTWQRQCVQVTEPKIRQNAIPSDFEHSLKNEDILDEFSESASTQKGSKIDENEPLRKERSWEVDVGKNEVMKRFFKKDAEQIYHEVQDGVKEAEEVKEDVEIQDSVTHKRMERAWGIWKTYVQKRLTRKREKTAYSKKIETFLMKLKEKKMEEERTKKLRCVMRFKQEIRANLPSKTQTNTQEEKEEKLKKLMQEIKLSQTEASQKLQEITKNSCWKQEKFSNVEFLKRMEERREERLKRRKEIQEKKRKAEEEKEKAQREQEEEKKRQEEECKRKSLEELKKKRRLEKERKEEHKKEREKYMLNMRLAENHYEIYLLRSYGLRPWGALMSIRKSQSQRAFTFFETRLKQKMFFKWTANVREQMAIRATRADAFYEKTLKRKSLFLWMQFHREIIKQNQVADDWNEFKITERAFKMWLDFTQDERMDYLNMKDAAWQYYERKLKTKCLTKLRSYPELKKIEQAKENRKRKWRQKVKEILPDYRPFDIPENI